MLPRLEQDVVEEGKKEERSHRRENSLLLQSHMNRVSQVSGVINKWLLTKQKELPPLVSPRGEMNRTTSTERLEMHRTTSNAEGEASDSAPIRNKKHLRFALRMGWILFI